MSIACRVLPFGVAEGPTNMALDEALLDAVAGDPSTAVLRTYGWSPATLSLGYFQSSSTVSAEPRLAGDPLVRRPTGGGAIWHDCELTYALVLPASHALARHAPELYRAVHEAIAGLIRHQGAPAQRRGPCPASDQKTRPFFCFTDCDPEDIVVGGVKVVGSAQRRRAGAILQHGSLLLRRSARLMDRPGLIDLYPLEPDPAAWSHWFADSIPPALELIPQAGALTGAERLRTAELERDLYRNAAWTNRR